MVEIMSNNNNISSAPAPSFMGAVSGASFVPTVPSEAPPASAAHADDTPMTVLQPVKERTYPYTFNAKIVSVNPNARKPGDGHEWMACVVEDTSTGERFNVRGNFPVGVVDGKESRVEEGDVLDKMCIGKPRFDERFNKTDHWIDNIMGFKVDRKRPRTDGAGAGPSSSSGGGGGNFMNQQAIQQTFAKMNDAFIALHEQVQTLTAENGVLKIKVEALEKVVKGATGAKNEASSHAPEQQQQGDAEQNGTATNAETA